MPQQIYIGGGGLEIKKIVSLELDPICQGGWKLSRPLLDRMLIVLDFERELRVVCCELGAEESRRASNLSFY